MIPDPSEAALLARLLAWDASFLPDVRTEWVDGGLEVLAVPPAGVPLARVARQPREVRAATALQLAAAAAFLFERGWYPGRRLLRSASVEQTPAGPALRLAALPGRRVDEAAVARVATRRSGEPADLPAVLVHPLLVDLLPERMGALAAARERRPAWEASLAVLEALRSTGRRGAALAHPHGPGRALWARRFAPPREGLVWVEERHVVSRVAAVAMLRAAAEGRVLEVHGGALEEEEMLRLQSRAAAQGREALVVSWLASGGVSPLHLDGGDDAVWVASPDLGRAHAWAAAALERGRHRPALAAELLASGAASGFTAAVAAEEGDGDREVLASAAARGVLAWLRSAPVGLAADEMDALAPLRDGLLAELERLRLAERRGAVWMATTAAQPARERLEAMVAALPPDSPRWMVAWAMVAGDEAPLLAWCDARLDEGRAREVAAVAGVLAERAAVALRCCEAALMQGRVGEGQRHLGTVPEGERGGVWRVLALWAAELAGDRAAARDALAPARRVRVPARLSARRWLVASDLARRGGDERGAQSALARAVRDGAGLVPRAAILAAMERGDRALVDLVRRARDGWSGDTLAFALHLMGYRRFERGAWAAAATGFRAALRVADGGDLELLARIHSDLASAAILLEQPAAAERHLLLAERLFTRSGSRRAVTLARGDRAVLACDRLDWKEARALLLACREATAEVRDSLWWLGELEEVRVDLARGDAAAALDRLPAVMHGVEPYLRLANFRQALASLHAHVALAFGDVLRAEAACLEAEKGERDLVLAVVRGDAGERPAAALPRRWGLTITAELLAALRRGDGEGGREALGRALARFPREAAVGYARFAVVLRARGERLDEGWTELHRRACAVLREAELDGWLDRARGAPSLDPVRLVRAIDAVVCAGSDALHPARLEELCAAVGLDGVEVLRGSEPLASHGVSGGEAVESSVGRVTVRGFGSPHVAARPVLELLARLVSVQAPAMGGETGAGSPLVGPSPILDEVRRQIRQWAPLSATVLVTGEPGTGKELAARELHRLSGRRGQFVPVNCAGIPASLLEAELFGAVRGAFTGADHDRMGLVEAAEGGTLFLDEIGELPTELQGKLLRLLQEREVRRIGSTRTRTVDVRFVAATNRDLARDVAAGRFRRDLYYRLVMGVIEMPPLRDRPDDVEALALLSVQRWSGEYRRAGVRLAPETVRAMRRCAWPGNVRELDLVVQRGVAAAAPGELLGPDRFPDLVSEDEAVEAELPTWAEAQQGLRRGYFTRLLTECGGNRSRAARRAGLSRQALLYHLRLLALRGDEGE